MTSTRPVRFERVFTVRDEDIDGLGHVNNVVYLQWVQDVAAGHWEQAATLQQRESVVWVAVRHEIDYKAPAFVGQDIVARTWVEEWGGATSERHTEIVRRADGALLARAKTVWCALDPASQRPRKVDADLRERFAEP